MLGPNYCDAAARRLAPPLRWRAAYGTITAEAGPPPEQTVVPQDARRLRGQGSNSSSSCITSASASASAGSISVGISISIGISITDGGGQEAEKEDRPASTGQ